MSAQSITRRLTQADLARLYAAGEKIAMFTCYDASFARLLDGAGVESLLIGDSLGNVIQGHDTTLPVTVADIAYHVAAVKRGSDRAFIIADMPFMSYGDGGSALRNAATLMQAGAQMVKLEGGAWLADTFRQMAERGIPTCAHLGLTPQSVNKFGGYKVQGRDADHAQQILSDAITLEQAGADLLVLECVPTPLATEITRSLSIPVIGIGAGPHTDAQVLVLYDMLGLTPSRAPKFTKNFLLGQADIPAALRAYVEDVKSGAFPAEEHSFK